MVSWIRNQEYFSSYSFSFEIERLFKGRIILQEQKQQQQKETAHKQKTPYKQQQEQKPQPYNSHCHAANLDRFCFDCGEKLISSKLIKQWELFRVSKITRSHSVQTPAWGLAPCDSR